MKASIVLPVLALPVFAVFADDLALQVREAETGYAKALNQRNQAAFQSYLAPDAVFLAGGSVLRGPTGAKRFFEETHAPFTREIEAVDVVTSGNLALVTGSVRGQDGKQSEKFNAVWRREANGAWKLVLNYPCPACNCTGSDLKSGPGADDVWRSEVAFAKTMADRDHAAFQSHVAEDAVFVSPQKPLRGREEVAEGWKRFYQGAQAPFSWGPDRVVVLDTGNLALSQGPVRNPAGKRGGTFSSIWRKGPDGRWRVVLDRGCETCVCKPEETRPQ